MSCPEIGSVGADQPSEKMLKLGNGATSRLRLAAAPDTGFLRIKVDIPVDGGRKPLVQSAPLTEIQAE